VHNKYFQGPESAPIRAPDFLPRESRVDAQQPRPFRAPPGRLRSRPMSRNADPPAGAAAAEAGRRISRSRRPWLDGIGMLAPALLAAVPLRLSLARLQPKRRKSAGTGLAENA